MYFAEGYLILEADLLDCYQGWFYGVWLCNFSELLFSHFVSELQHKLPQLGEGRREDTK